MFRTTLVAVCCCLACQPTRADEVHKTIAEGAWSKPVADSRGYAVRGRLVVSEKPGAARRATAVYVELREASEFIGADLQLFCEMGKHDFRPEYKNGLNCELLDKDNKPVPSQPFPFGGGTPKSQWITLPSDATIRLRATPFGIGSDEGLAICPHLGSLWVIGNDDQKEYSLSGTFTVDPAEVQGKPEQGHVWRGTIALPAVQIVNGRK